MKKTINLSKEIHKNLKIYSASQEQNMEHTLERVLTDFLIRAGTIPSKEVRADD